MSILAADSAQFPQLFAALLLIVGTVVSTYVILAGLPKLGVLRAPPEDSAGTLFLILLGTLGFLLVGTAIGATLAKQVASEELRTQIAGLIGTVAAVIGALSLNSLYRRDAMRRLGLDPAMILPGIKAGAVGIILVLPWVFWTSFGVEAVMKQFHIQAPTIHEIFRLWESPEGQSMGFRVGAVVAAVFVAPFSEELLFRGLLQTLIVRLLYPVSGGGLPRSDLRRSWLAIAMTALVFAAIHRPWTIQPAIFVLALGLGLAYERRGNLWTSITMHCLFNAINFTIFLLTH